MPLTINLRMLAQATVVLTGGLPAAELDLCQPGDLLQVLVPVQYDLEVELTDNALLVQGGLSATLDCECVRCLKKFKMPLNLDPYVLHLPLEGEEAATVDNDNVDLTPFLREDMLLEFPQHPLCKPECAGLKKIEVNQARKAGKKPEANVSAWAELNKLKL